MLDFPDREERSLDIICLGRAGVDLYAEKEQTPLAEADRFIRQMGGSSGNIAVGCARLGLRTGMISRVAADPLGEFVFNFLRDEGVNVRGVGLDNSGTRTSLAITEQNHPDCAVVFYRHRPADMALAPEHIDEGYIASARLLLLTGTALSAEPSRAACWWAIDCADRHATPVALDLDYRAHAWASLDEAADVLGRAAARCRLLIGNREEFDVLDGRAAETAEDDATSAARYQRDGVELLVIKHGARGARLYPRNGEPVEMGIYPLQAKKPFGAGDAYAASLCAGLLQGRSLADSARRGAAAAALVVSRTGCAAASPRDDEIEALMAATAMTAAMHDVQHNNGS